MITGTMSVEDGEALSGFSSATVLLIVAAFFIGGAVVPQSTVDSWTQQAEESSHSQTPDEPENPADSDH